MRLVWLGLGALAALTACEAYPGGYDTGYGYSYASPPVAGDYYGGYYGGYAPPYYGPVAGGSTVILDGGRHWDSDHWQGDRDRRWDGGDRWRGERASADRGRPVVAQPPHVQAYEAPRPVAVPRPAPAAFPPAPPAGTHAREEYNRRYINAAPSLLDTGGGAR
jgi:hypothetical protein